MTVIKKKTFTYETVVIDDHAFIDCTFTECIFMYAGGDFVFMPGCVLNKCTYYFQGPARRTYDLIQAHKLAAEHLPVQTQTAQATTVN